MTSEGLPGIGAHRYEGYSLEAKYGWLQQGQGVEAVTGGADLLAKLAGDFAESERTIRTALGRLGVSWSGTAAEQAAAALRSVADWAGGSAASSAGGSATIGEYGESFARLRSRVAEPPSLTRGVGPGVPPDGLPGSVPPDLGAVGGLQSDYRGRLAEYQRLDRAANDALYAHEAQSRAAVRAFPIPEAPPAVAAVTVASITTGMLTSHGSSRVGVPGQRGPDQGADPTVQTSAPTQPSGAQPATAQPATGKSPAAQPPTTVPAAGGVARAGGAVPDPGLPGDGHGAPLGVDPGGVLGGLAGLGQPGRGGEGRSEGRARRGSGFLPGDEPFAVDCDDVPAVLGLPDGDEQRW